MKIEGSLFDRYIDSCAFISSLVSMEAFLEESLTADFDQERNPLRVIAVVVFTCTRMWDERPLPRMAQLAHHYASRIESWEDEFRYNYALVAARELDSAALLPYLELEGDDAFRCATRIASLAYFLRDEVLLFASVRAQRAEINRRPIAPPDKEWELEFAEAMYSALKCGRAYLVSLCRTASRLEGCSYLPYVSTDVQVLQRSLARCPGSTTGSA